MSSRIMDSSAGNVFLKERKMRYYLSCAHNARKVGTKGGSLEDLEGGCVIIQRIPVFGAVIGNR